MTNITFTKGIGTPVFMAPEILNRQHYKDPADIYSFAITMYETMIWGSAYPKNKFPHEWDIANYVCKGKRLEKPSTMNEHIYSIITQCWCQEPKERMNIISIVQKLQSL